MAPLNTAPARAGKTLDQRSRLRATTEFAELTAAFQRVRRIVPAGTDGQYTAGLFELPAERNLARALEEVKLAISDPRDLGEVVRRSRILVRPINEFFDDVLVMAADQSVRANRLGLLASVYSAVSDALAWDQLT